MVSGRERSIGAKTTFPSHLDAALGFSLTQRPQQVVGGETTAYYATCRLPPVSSGPRALRPRAGETSKERLFRLEVRRNTYIFARLLGAGPRLLAK